MRAYTHFKSSDHFLFLSDFCPPSYRGGFICMCSVLSKISAKTNCRPVPFCTKCPEGVYRQTNADMTYSWRHVDITVVLFTLIWSVRSLLSLNSLTMSFFLSIEKKWNLKKDTRHLKDPSISHQTSERVTVAPLTRLSKKLFYHSLDNTCFGVWCECQPLQLMTEIVN